MLNQYDSLPEGLLDTPAGELHRILPGPSLFHLQGELEQPAFISVLLHGNETTGWDAIRRYLKTEPVLPRSLSLFVGNVEAAAQARRRLPGTADYNRIWSQGDSAEHQMTATIVAEMKKRRPFISIDIHNNTGRNPHYGCINKLEREFVDLAHLFSPTIVYFTKPDTVQSIAFAEICPAVTVECGQATDRDAIDHAYQFIKKSMDLTTIPRQTDKELKVYHTVAVLKVPEVIDFSFNGDSAALRFDPALAFKNFTEMPAGSDWGSWTGDGAPFELTSEAGDAVFDKYFTVQDGRILSTQSFMPSMITTNIEIIRQDCLCYLMERYQLPWID